MIGWTIGLALANDAPYAAIGSTGQLELTTESEIFIARERLEIEPATTRGYDFHVRVTYTFRNPTSAPREVRLAFPVADCPISRLFHHDRQAPAMTLTVDGAPYPAGQWVVTVHDGAAPITGAEASAFVDAAGAWDLDAICAAARARAPSLDCREGDAAFRATYTWEHTFAPGDTTVVHDYLVDGASGGSTDDTPHWEEAPRACAPVGFRTHQRALEYVLTTAARWAKPIGEFELVVRPGGATVASCFAGLERAEDGTLRARRTNFTPTEELVVAFYTPVGSPIAAGSVGPDDDPCGFYDLLAHALSGWALDPVQLQCTSTACTTSGPAWSPEALRILRNAVFARHGRPFESADLNAWFYGGGAARFYEQKARGECMSGDTPLPRLVADRAFTEGRLSAVDRDNVARIQQAEAASR